MVLVVTLLGVGLRWRVEWVVALELEAGEEQGRLLPLMPSLVLPRVGAGAVVGMET